MTKKTPRTGGRTRKTGVKAGTPDLEKGKAAVKAVIQRLQATSERYTADAEVDAAVDGTPTAAAPCAGPFDADAAAKAPVATAVRPSRPELLPSAPPAPKTGLPGSSSSTDRIIDVKPPHDLVAREAYLIWRSRGGDALENWLLAEQRVAQTLSDGSRTS